MLAESRYNYEFTDSDGAVCVCNGISGALIVKPEVPLTSPLLAPEDREFLVEQAFLVEEGADELAALLKRNKALTDRGDRLELTLMLHEDCNFRCTYCFEDFTDRKLDGDTLDDLTAFVDRSIPQGGSVSAHFYGGEPLMAWSSLVRINEALKEIVSRRQARYQFFVTTNGSLLTQERARYLAAEGAAHVKITLDGPPEVHDTRRVRVNGSGTFAQILRNLRQALPLLQVILRVNVDARNKESIFDLINIIAEECSPAEHLRFEYNLVYDRHTQKLMPGMTYDDLHRIHAATLDRGFRLNLPPLTRYRYCKFNSKNSYLVDSGGEMYLCAKSQRTHVGALPGRAPEERAAPRRLPIVGAGSVFAEFQEPKPNCVSCNLLPICGGGCTLLSLTEGEPPCPPWKASYKQYLQTLFRNMEPRRGAMAGA